MVHVVIIAILICHVSKELNMGMLVYLNWNPFCYGMRWCI